MNPILNQLYSFYLSREEYFTKNKLPIPDEISETKIVLGIIRESHFSLKFNEAHTMLDKLELNSQFIKEIKNLILYLQTENLPYERPTDHIAIDFPEINAKLLEIKQHLLNLNEKVSTINDSNNIKVTVSDELKQLQNAIPIESINALKNCIQTSEQSHESALQINLKLSEILPAIKNIDSLLNEHLARIKNDFLEVLNSYKEQTIASISSIKESAIETSNMIAHNLPDQVNKITDSIPLKIENSINKSIWKNMSLSGVIFLLVMLVCLWLMGRVVGHTISEDIVKNIRQNISPVLTFNSNQNKR